ncbi:ABC transporter ATP-binding protein [Kordiimonas laminariae]|uniref:ABC transporter ATP-binding protein n=1 Tax=Kordiimonas laminariae TaxID=2917717 RepID=UPI001FF3DBD2|nr:ABC transporter ATP-binding protein [Kordiimonas laminariae]MCK0068881.1 ABC transporter ATP-binding protein [Kordiimonas laminariae]
MSEVLAIETRELSKRFGAVRANDGISLQVGKGTVHGIVGENGAGKSTLLKMLFGFYTPDSGDVLVQGEHVSFVNPADAMARGVGMVHQHFMLVEPFTVLENIILGAETSSKLDEAKEDARKALIELEEKFGFDLPLDEPVENLAVGVRQRAEILKALYKGAEILILDEPTAVLTPQECEQLFELVKLLREQGKTVLFVTHKLHEIMATTDDVTVIRAGKVVARRKTSETSCEELAELMVGAKVVREVARESHGATAARLSLHQVNACNDQGHAALKNVSLDVHDGEVLGIAGVAGNGQTELLEVVTGLRGIASGSISFSGDVVATDSITTDPITLRRMGMAHVAEDRLKTGVVESMSAKENIILGYQREPDFVSRGVLKLKHIAQKAADYFESQDVRPRNPNLEIGSFSGGNQQKVVIAREIARDPQLMVIGQPTRGVDIGAVTKIHDQITELRNAGKAMLVVSADLDELLAISDRIAVMCEGEITGVLPVEDADEKTLGLLMAGGSLDNVTAKEEE